MRQITQITDTRYRIAVALAVGLIALAAIGCGAPAAQPRIVVFDDEVVELLVVSSIGTTPKYDRDSWNYPADVDGDCINTRHEILQASSGDPAVMNDTGCYVSEGTWTDPYSGDSYTDPRQLQIDHLVPLHNAHQSGGGIWTSGAKTQFANDPNNLVAVFGPLNEMKGSQGPEEWRPPNKDYWCTYATTWANVKAQWGLTATVSEWVALIEMSEEC